MVIIQSTEWFKIMDVLSIVEARLRSAADLKKRFNKQQWYNIASNFFTQRSGKITNTDFRSRNKYFQREIGFEMADDMTPENWQLKAAVYGISVNSSMPSWVDIYNTIAPYADKNLGFDYADSSPEDKGTELTDQTPESREEVTKQWVPIQTREWTDFDKFRAEYFLPWMAMLKKKRSNITYKTKNYGESSWWDLALKRKVQAKGSPIQEVINPRFALLMKIYENFKKKDTIKKEEVDIELWAWLRGTDQLLYARYGRQ